MKVSVAWSGGRELDRALRSLPARVSRRVLLEALRDSAEIPRSAMARKAPVGPKAPHIKDRIVVSNSRGVDAQEAAVAIGPEKGSYYGSFQELGTAHHAAQPFVRPGLDESVMATLQALGASLWTALASRGLMRTATVETPVEGGPDGGGLL